tara:strand:+ start:1068 stop:1307 length:240 start_codon:yes stop_codon:yes gene_type:complete
VTGIRKPKDDEELNKAKSAVNQGMGMTVENFIAYIIGSQVDKETVNVVKNRIEYSMEIGEHIDIEELVNSIIQMQSKWA